MIRYKIKNISAIIASPFLDNICSVFQMWCISIL